MSESLRNLTLSNQGLISGPKFGSKLSGTLNAIEHLGYVQIDTISVVERAHHHVLWNRVPDYAPTQLNQLVANKQIFEYWSHAASYLPMRDYRFALPQMASVRRGENRYYNNVDEQVMNEVLVRVHAEGPLRTRQFDKGDKTKGGWWNWGPAKLAIERLFMQGDLMVCERIGMEKAYDIAERCLPADIDTRMPSLDEYATYLLATNLRSHGVITWKQLAHLKTGKPIRDALTRVLEEGIDYGDVHVFDQTGTPIDNPRLPLKLGKSLSEKSPFYFANASSLEATPRANRKLKILSPFDNVLIHRERLNALFNFDYKIECYVPKATRQYGYFCLPIMYGNEFVARIDCKAHRAEKRLEVISLNFEGEWRDSKQLMLKLNNEIQRYAEFNQCSTVDFC
ncbi:winged helix-turn-helix domain-containing protein [Glaciecola sp. MF2-115]|uniref:winged helix-turn-helix domain-containing protein n=1 Tax=Glaciecola sp. MF2-115 TaxID=3384827 RepID=UPI00399F098C